VGINFRFSGFLPPKFQEGRFTAPRINSRQRPYQSLLRNMGLGSWSEIYDAKNLSSIEQMEVWSRFTAPRIIQGKGCIKVPFHLFSWKKGSTKASWTYVLLLLKPVKEPELRSFLKATRGIEIETIESQLESQFFIHSNLFVPV